MPSGYISQYTNPWDFYRTAPGFEVTMLGQVRRALTKEELPIEMIDGIPCVFTGKYWRFFRSPKEGYNTVADMVALNYKPLYLPVSLLGKASAYPIDGNENNLHPKNLIWKFSEPIAVPWAPDYFYIPGYTRFAISKQGVIIRAEDVREMKLTVRDNGYADCSLEADIPRAAPLNTRYRASALAFLDYPVTIDSLVVNHRNGVRDDDYPSNLEWIKQVENMRHGSVRKALGIVPPDYTYRLDCYSVEKTLELYKQHGIKPPAVAKIPVVETPPKPVLSEEEKAKEYYDRSNFKNINIKRLDIHSGEVVTFTNRQQAIKETGILDNQLYQSVNSPLFEEYGYGLVKGQWIFRYEHMGFPEITPLFILEITQSGGTRRKVLFKNKRNGEIHVFEGVRPGCDKLALLASIVFGCLSRNSQAVPGTHWLVKFEDSLMDWEA